MSQIDPSVLGENDPVLAEALRHANSTYEIQQILRDRAVDLGGVRDSRDPSKIDTNKMQVFDPNPNGTKAFQRTMVINGVEHQFEANSEGELWKQIAGAYENAHAAQSQQTQDPVQPRGDNGQFVDRNDPVFKAELDLKLKRGDISVAEYIEQSGALDTYARERLGIDPDAVRDNREVQSWQEATQKFLDAHDEWPGGDANRDLLGSILAANPQVLESGDKLAALEAAYNYARENGLLVKNPLIEAHDRIANASSAEEIAHAARLAQGRTDSGLWGR